MSSRDRPATAPGRGRRMAENRIIPTARALAEIVTDPVLKVLILQ
jgi:hypothetical protein